MEDLFPVAGQLTFGAVAGFLSGYALKKVGRVLAFLLGILFVTLQLLAYAGYIEVKWTRIQQDVEPFLNQDSLEGLWNEALKVLTYNFPFAASFTAGFIWGLKRG